jgi:hypothetical protein
MDRRPDGEVLEYAANFSIVTVEQAVAAVGGLRESFDPAGKG